MSFIYTLSELGEDVNKLTIITVGKRERGEGAERERERSTEARVKS